ncbi:MAG: hypothetical protein R3A10_17270 [Caldilineaceae bacterium]
MNIVYVAPFGLGRRPPSGNATLPLAQQMVARGHRRRHHHPAVGHAGTGRRNAAHGRRRRPGQRDAGRRSGHGHPAHAAGDPRGSRTSSTWSSPGPTPGWSSGGCGKQRRLGRSVPMLILDVDDWEQAWSTVNDYGPAMSRFLTCQEEWGIRHADGITAASRWLENRAQSYAPATPVHYLPNGVTLPPVAKNVSAAEAMQARDRAAERALLPRASWKWTLRGWPAAGRRC